MSATVGFVGEVDPVEYRRQVYANAAASLVLGDAFIRACRPGYESGLVMISSASAKFAMQGHAVYGAAKAGMEQWVRAVRAERKSRGAGPWVVAIRPGFVVTEEMRANQGKPVQVTILRDRKQQTLNLQVDSKHKTGALRLEPPVSSGEGAVVAELN